MQCIGKEYQSQSPWLTNMMITSIFVRRTEVSLIGHDTSADLDLGAGRGGGLPPQIKWLSPRNSSPPHTMAVWNKFVDKVVDTPVDWIVRQHEWKQIFPINCTFSGPLVFVLLSFTIFFRKDLLY